MLIELYCLSGTAYSWYALQKNEKTIFFLCCQETFAFQNVNFHLLIIGDFYVNLFSHEGFCNENLSLPCSIITCCISVWSGHIPVVTTPSRRPCFHRTKCTFFYSCFSQTQKVLSWECGTGACCEKNTLLAIPETFFNSQKVRAAMGSCLCSTWSPGRWQRWSSLLLYHAQVMPLFGNLSSLKSCLGSPDLPRHLRRKYSPSGFLEMSCPALTGRNGKLHPLLLPSCRRGEQEAFLSLNMLFFLRPWEMN